MYDSDHHYHHIDGYVHAGDLAIEIGAIWSSVDHAEAAGVPLSHIAAALRHNWSATAVALASLRAIIDEVRS